MISYVFLIDYSKLKEIERRTNLIIVTLRYIKFLEKFATKSPINRQL